MFGGITQSSYSNDLYIVDLKRHSVVSVKLSHGGGACPVNTGELHLTNSDKKYMYNYYQLSLSLIMRNGLGLRTRLLTTRRTILRQHSITYLWTERKCVVHWYAHEHHMVDTVLHVVVMMGQDDHTLPPHTRGPPLHK